MDRLVLLRKSMMRIKRQFAVNVFGSISMIKAVLPFMRARKGGHILNITSIAGLNGFPGIGIYNGSKFALENWEALAQEVEPLGLKLLMWSQDHLGQIGLELQRLMRLRRYPITLKLPKKTQSPLRKSMEVKKGIL